MSDECKCGAATATACECALADKDEGPRTPTVSFWRESPHGLMRMHGFELKAMMFINGFRDDAVDSKALRGLCAFVHPDVVKRIPLRDGEDIAVHFDADTRMLIFEDAATIDALVEVVAACDVSAITIGAGHEHVRDAVIAKLRDVVDGDASRGEVHFYAENGDMLA